MSGTISTGGLITGLDSSTLIDQLMAIESQSLTRVEAKISALEAQKSALSTLRTDLQSLMNLASNFSLGSVFGAYESTTSDDDVLGVDVTGANPVMGSYEIEVLQLATATTAQSSGELGAAIDSTVALNNSGISTDIEEGTFTINGVEFTVDPATDSLDDILADINASAAGVTATYDPATDRVTFTNSVGGDTSYINFGESDEEGESNILEVLGVTEATQEGETTTLTSTRNLGAINAGEELSTVQFADGAVTAGTFSINGVAITVDPTSDSISDVIAAINSSEAGVTASYDTSTDTIRVISDTMGSTTVRFGSASDTSNFLDIVNLSDATQAAGKNAKFTINGGEVLTRNTNEVSDAIGGVTLDLLSVGTSTIKISDDTDAIVEGVQEFLDELNSAIANLQSLYQENGDLEGDSTVRLIQDFLRTTIYSQVGGASGDYTNLFTIGISTGDDFDSSSISVFELDTEAFLEALSDDRQAVINLFTNEDGTGIADLYDEYLDDATSYTGFLNQRVKSNGTIDQQIDAYNNQLDRLEERLAMKEERLVKQFANLELMASSYQSQASALSGLTSLYTSL